MTLVYFIGVFVISTIFSILIYFEDAKMDYFLHKAQNHEIQILMQYKKLPQLDAEQIIKDASTQHSSLIVKHEEIKLQI